jgi:sialate O-acetylesterase
MSRNHWKCMAALAILIATPLARAEVKLPSVLADHMVIQRDRPVHLWGSADPGEQVTVSFRDQQGSIAADSLGRWSLYLRPGDAGGPFTLIVKGNNTITFTDVLVGDIWIASGQSNMEMPMTEMGGFRGVQNFQQEIAAANYPRLRLFHTEEAVSSYPMPDVAARTWTRCTPQSVSEFSAAAYYFGRELFEKEKVPIGLIETDWGGTPAEAWTSLGALGSNASLMPVFAARASMMQDEATTLLQQKSEEKLQASAKAEGKPPISFPWHPDPNSWAPAALFNAMVAPFTPLPIRGVIWYQGESNTGPERAPIYSSLFQTMIQDWRSHWAQGDFPFLFVQIANFNTTGDWPLVREAQRKTLSLANTGMAVAIDIGDSANIHPRDKQDVGHRLALWARVLSYGEHVEDSGPLFRQAAPQGREMRVWFDHAANGVIGKGGALRGFEIAGADGKFVSANAKIDGSTVLVSSTAVPAPVYVRYGWSADPNCNLYNVEGLPASPFSSQQ